MKEKIVGIFVCMLMIFSAVLIPVSQAVCPCESKKSDEVENQYNYDASYGEVADLQQQDSIDTDLTNLENSIDTDPTNAGNPNHCWWSDKGDNLINNLYSPSFYLAFDSSISFWHHYDIKDGENGFFEITIDGGITWMTMHTYNGQQMSWKEEIFDLSPYTGNSVQFRFTYVTNRMPIYMTNESLKLAHGDGWYVDNISIPKIGFFDDVESGQDGWTTGGWKIIPENVSCSFTYNITAWVSEDTGGEGSLCSITGCANVTDKDYDKFIVNLNDEFKSTVNSIENISITFGGNTYYGDPDSDIFITNKSVEYCAWIVSEPRFELHAACKLAENIDHLFNYKILAEGTSSPTQYFDYTITAFGDEEYHAISNISESHELNVEPTFFKTKTKQDPDTWYTKDPLDFTSAVRKYIHGRGNPQDLGISPTPSSSSPKPLITNTVKVSNYAWGFLGGWVNVLYILTREGKLTRPWKHTQKGSSNVTFGEGNKYIAEYVGTNNSGLSGYLRTLTTNYKAESNNNPKVKLTMNETCLFAITDYREYWVKSLSNSGSINVSEGVKEVDELNVTAPNNDTVFSIVISVYGTGSNGPVIYRDINKDGKVEFGQPFAWMDGQIQAMPVDYKMLAAFNVFPPSAYIDSIVINETGKDVRGGVALFGEDVTFSGYGEPGDNITAHLYRSNKDGVIYSIIGSTPANESSFTTNSLSPANPHLIKYNVLNNEGVWSPLSSDSIDTLVVNKPPVAYIKYINGEVDSKGQILSIVGDPIDFSGVGIDTDGWIAGYNWTIDDRLDDISSNTSVFTCNDGHILTFGNHTIHFKVKDNQGTWSRTVSKNIKIVYYPVLLLHKYLSSPESMDKIKDALMDQFDVYSIDFRKPVAKEVSFKIPLKSPAFDALLGLIDIYVLKKQLESDWNDLMALKDGKLSDLNVARQKVLTVITDMRSSLGIIQSRMNKADNSGLQDTFKDIDKVLGYIEKNLTAPEPKFPPEFNNLLDLLKNNFVFSYDVVQDQEIKITDLSFKITLPEKITMIILGLLEIGKINIPGELTLFSKDIDFGGGKFGATVGFKVKVKDLKLDSTPDMKLILSGALAISNIKVNVKIKLGEIFKSGSSSSSSGILKSGSDSSSGDGSKSGSDVSETDPSSSDFPDSLSYSIPVDLKFIDGEINVEFNHILSGYNSVTGEEPIPDFVIGENAMKKNIVDTAISQIGEHYLSGAEGEYGNPLSSQNDWDILPNCYGGMDPTKPPEVEMSPDYPHVAVSHFNSKSTLCQGRNNISDVKNLEVGNPEDATENAIEYNAFKWARDEDWGEIYGEACDNARHFDCVGLVCFCYSASDFILDHNMNVQGLKNMCKMITEKELQPGDLCFIGNDHVGIYVGPDAIKNWGRKCPYYGDKSWYSNYKWDIVHASKEDRGVILGSTDMPDWNSFGRLLETKHTLNLNIDGECGGVKIVPDNGEATVTCQSGKYKFEEGTNVELSVAGDSTCTPGEFDHWEGDIKTCSDGTCNSGSVLMDGDKDVTAVFIEKAKSGKINGEQGCPTCPLTTLGSEGNSGSSGSSGDPDTSSDAEILNYPELKITFRLDSSFLNFKLANGDMKDYADEVSKKIDEIKKETGLPKVSLVGDEMGADIAQWYINYGYRHDVDKAVLMGAPLHGSDLAYYGPQAVKLLIKMLCKLLPGGGELLSTILDMIIDIILGEAINQMAPHSSYLKALNQNDKCPAPEIPIIWEPDESKDTLNPNVDYCIIQGLAPNIGDFVLPLTLIHLHAKIPYTDIVGTVPFIWQGDLFVTPQSASLDGVKNVHQILGGWHWGLSENDEAIGIIKKFLNGSSTSLNNKFFNSDIEDLGIDDNTIDNNTLEQMKNQSSQWFDPMEGYVNTTQTITHNITLDSTVTNATFSLQYNPTDSYWNETYDMYKDYNADLNLSLIDPNNIHITPAYAATNHSINYTKISSFGRILYKIKNPIPGKWSLIIEAVNITCPSNTTGYTAFVSYDTTLRFSVGISNNKSYNPNDGVNISEESFKPHDEVNISAFLNYSGKPLEGANVIAYIKKMINVTNGTGVFEDKIYLNDMEKGNYSVVYSNTSLEGTYYMNVVASVPIDGKIINRSATVIFWVEALPDLTLSQSDISFSNSSPLVGQIITINATIHNVGDGNATNAKIEFRDNLTTIGFDIINVTVNKQTKASINWSATYGEHDINISISPYNSFLEKNYTNNTALRTISVGDMEPPVAEAGQNQIARKNTPVFFDASMSTDNVGIVRYTWDLDNKTDSNGDKVFDNDSDLTDVYNSTRGFNKIGTYIVTLTVYDAAGNSANDTLAVIVVEETDYDTEEPFVYAGPNQEVMVGEPTYFDGHHSSDNYGIASCLWDVDCSWDNDGDGISDNDVDLITMHPLLEKGYPISGRYVVKLTVDDVEGNGPMSDYMMVTVKDSINYSCLGDKDCDGLLDQEDNCPECKNPDQADYDQDGVGDCCWCTKIVTPYENVQDAIDNANYGDVICLKSRAYYYNLTLNITKNNIILDGLGATLYGEEIGNGITIKPGVINTTVQNCYITNYSTGINIAGNGQKNKIRNNNIYENKNYGINIQGSGGKLIDNEVCGNGVDIRKTGIGDYSGDSNTCNTTNNWNDDGCTGCTFDCHNCTIPTDGMIVTKNTLLCPGVYYLPHGIKIGASGITLKGDNTVIYGNLREAPVSIGIENNGYSNVKIKNIEIRNYSVGINFYGSMDSSIVNNKVVDNIDGIHLSYSWTTISNNEISDNFGVGLIINSPQSDIITNNLLDNNLNRSILMSGDTEGSILIKENILNNGLRISSASFRRGAIVLNNRISFPNGLDVVSVENSSPTAIYFTNNEVYDGLLNGFSIKGGSYVFLDNYVHDLSTGFLLENNYGSQITNTTIENTDTGIYVVNSVHNDISNNAISTNNFISINLNQSSYTTINNNVFNNIYLEKSSNNSIINNNAPGQDANINLEDSSHNTVNKNSDASIGLFNCSDNTITNNSVSNQIFGITLVNSSENIISSNNITANSECGIALVFSSNNIIYNNYFNNTNNAYDNKTNKWNITKTSGTNIVNGPYLGGNYWSNYTGADTNGDGLGETPYIIPGGNNRDMRPLVKPAKIITRNIPFSTGWNLITVPVENNYRASSLAKNISGCQMVSRFDAVNQTFKTYIVGGPPSFDFPIADGYGYFVLVNRSSTASLSGSHIESVSVPLGVGWDTIGWYHMSDTLASSLGSNISGCQMVSRFDAVNQTFKTYIVGGPPSFDFTVTPGMGLFVLVDKASIWHGGG